MILDFSGLLMVPGVSAIRNKQKETKETKIAMARRG